MSAGTVSEITMLIFMEHGMHMFLHEFKREVTRWRQRWLFVEDGYPLGGNAGICQPRPSPWNLRSRQDASHISCLNAC